MVWFHLRSDCLDEVNGGQRRVRHSVVRPRCELVVTHKTSSTVRLWKKSRYQELLIYQRDDK